MEHVYYVSNYISINNWLHWSNDGGEPLILLNNIGSKMYKFTLVLPIRRKETENNR